MKNYISVFPDKEREELKSLLKDNPEKERILGIVYDSFNKGFVMGKIEICKELLRTNPNVVISKLEVLKLKDENTLELLQEVA